MEEENEKIHVIEASCARQWLVLHRHKKLIALKTNRPIYQQNVHWTSLQNGARRTNCQIWSYYSRIDTIPRTLTSLSDVPVDF